MKQFKEKAVRDSSSKKVEVSKIKKTLRRVEKIRKIRRMRKKIQPKVML